MTSFYDSYDYYKKMLELQEKLRKSEEERIRLEERFKILAQESRNRHDACINRLRLRYIEFLEEQRARNERSHKLLEALERVDNSLALMTAKTDRLNVLRKQYEGYLRRMYKVPNPSESTIGDSNNVKQRDDTYLRRDATAERIDLPSDIKSTSQLEMFPRNGAVNRSISPSPSKWMKLPQSTYRDNCERSVAQPKSLNQQMNDSPNILRIYSTIPESLNVQLPNQSPSLQTFQQKQFHDQHLYPSQLPSSRSSTSIQQIVPHSHRPSFERAETARTVSQIDIPERINGSISRYKFIDVPPNRFTPIALQHYVRPSPTMQSFRQENDKVSLGDKSKQTRIGTQISQVYTIPVTPERNVRGTSLLNKSMNLPRKTVPCYMSSSPRKSDYLRKSMTESPARLLTASAVDDIIKRHKRFSPKGSGSPRSSMETRESSIEDDERRTAIVVENELDRYIDKIKKLHRDLDAQSLEELDQKQNTHDNILNASSLDDNIEFSNGGQSKGNLPKEVEKVLALANDLAFRSVDLNVASDTGKGCTDENRKLGLVGVTRNDTTISERTNVMFSDMNEGREPSEPHAKDRISNDIKLPEPKLDSYENIEKPWKQNLSGLGNVLEQHEQESSKTLADADIVASSDDIVMERKNTEDIVAEDVEIKDDGIYVAEESNLQQYSFDVAEELEPWNLDILQKRIKEIDLIGDSESQYSGKEIVTDASKLNQDNIEHAAFSSDLDNLKNQEVELDSKGDMNINEADSDSAKDRFEQGTIEHLEQEEASTDKKAEETSETSALRHSTIEHDNNKDTNNVNDVQNENSEEQRVDAQNEFGNEQGEECNENNSIADVNQNNEQQVATQGEEYNNQNYYDDSNQAENYTGNYETEYAGVNEEYNYEQNTPYEGNQEQNYDPNVPSEADQQQHYEGNVGYETNQDQSYDQNVAYDANENQGYEEYINQEYVQGSNEQYGEYVGEQDDSGNQYEQDPNAQYQEDTNQQYAYTYDQQYALNEEGNAAVNQPTEYTAFESNQSDLKQEEERPNEEQREFQEESGHQEEENVNKGQNKNEKLPPENEPKKKKDVIKSLLDSDTDSTIERNVSNTESDFDFN